MTALLARIDALDSDACGAMAFGGNPPSGLLRIEQRRVCWAASDSSPRLLDRLRHSVHADVRELETLFKECRDRGTPLGQTLVERGRISADHLRSILLQHTAAVIAQLAKTAPGEPQWVESRNGRHDARFTFTPAELLTHIADAEWGPLAQLAREELTRTLQSGGRGCAFVPSGETLLPIGLVGTELEVREIVALGGWAQHALANASRLSSGSRMVSLARGAETLTAWTSAGFVYAALGTDRSDFSCILAHLKSAERDLH